MGNGLGGVFGQNPNTVHRAYVDVMMAAARVDGNLSPAKLDDLVISALRHDDMKKMGERNLIDMIQKSYRASFETPLGERLSAIARALPKHEQRLTAFGMAYSVAKCDGPLNPRELSFLEQLQAHLGLDMGDVDDLTNR